MKCRLLVPAAPVLAVVLAPLIVSAQTDDYVNGLVTKIEEAGGRIVIKHGTIKKFDMAGMTMAFRANDPAMLKEVKPGDKVRFVRDRINGQFTVTTIEKAK